MFLKKTLHNPAKTLAPQSPPNSTRRSIALPFAFVRTRVRARARAHDSLGVGRGAGRAAAAPASG